MIKFITVYFAIFCDCKFLRNTVYYNAQITSKLFYIRESRVKYHKDARYLYKNVTAPTLTIAGITRELMITFISRPVVARGHKRVSVNAAGCAFDSH